MSLVTLLVTLIVLGVIGYVAAYIIDRFFPAPINMPAKVLVGLLLLLVLLQKTGLLSGVSF